MTSRPANLGRFALALVLAPLLATGARAQENAHKHERPAAAADSAASGCAAFKWPLDAERKAFEAAELEKVSSGAARGDLKDQAFVLALEPEANVPFTLAPTKRKQDADKQRYGGMVAFAAPDKSGTYQVTLSAEGWIDLVQRGAALKTTDHSSVKDCPGLRKSVRFTVGDAPLVLQISGAPSTSVNVGIRLIEAAAP